MIDYMIEYENCYSTRHVIFYNLNNNDDSCVYQTFFVSAKSDLHMF